MSTEDSPSDGPGSGLPPPADRQSLTSDPAPGVRAAAEHAAAEHPGRGEPVRLRTREHVHEMQATYRYLRLALILLTLLLLFSVILQIVADGGDVLPSVSAYYYTGARDVFVASLCAIGVCLIIHRGRSDTEDLLLNGAGYLSFFIAFVPTTPARAGFEQAAGLSPGLSLEFLSEEFIASATQNTWAILAAGLVGLVIEIVVLPQRERHGHSRGGTVVLVASVVAFLALSTTFVAAPGFFLTYAHGITAVLWFVCIVGIVGVNAIGMSRSRAEQGVNGRRRWMNLYGLGFVLILTTLPVFLGPVRMVLEQWVFALEVAVFLQFLAFWVTQTVERWYLPTRRADALVPG